MPLKKSEDYKKTWQERDNYHKVMKSWINAATLVVNATGINLDHKKKLLDPIVWKATESQGTSKYDTRFVSESIYTLPQGLTIDIHFEHVTPKKSVVLNLLKESNNISEILYNAKVCTVTCAEHNYLQQHGRGWDRYLAAKINVYDRKENKLINLLDEGQ